MTVLIVAQGTRSKSHCSVSVNTLPIIIIIRSEAYLIVAPGQAPLTFSKQDWYLKLRAPLCKTEDSMRISVG